MDYSDILFRAKQHVQADELMDDDYFTQLYLCIRQFLDDVDVVTALKCVLSELKNSDKKVKYEQMFGLGLEGDKKEKISKKMMEQFKQINEKLHPKSNLTNLLWVEAIFSGAGDSETFLNIVEELKRKLVNNKHG